MTYFHYILGLALFAFGASAGYLVPRLLGRRRHEQPLVAEPAEAPPQMQTVLPQSVHETPKPETVGPQNAADDPKPTAEAGKVAVRPLEVERRVDDNDFAQKLMQLIEARIDQRSLQVDMLAGEMAMSHTLFYERVNRVFGESPAALIRNYRLKRAHEMLVNEKRTVAEVALLCGFGDAKYFSTVFKKHYNISPSKVASAL